MSRLDTEDPDGVVLHPVPGDGVKVLPAVMEVIRTVYVIVLEVSGNRIARDIK